MLGGVFGSITGIGLRFETTIDYKDFELSRESEGFLQTQTSNGDFFYNWTELSYSIREWVRIGFAYQQTNVITTGAAHLKSVRTEKAVID